MGTGARKPARMERGQEEDGKKKLFLAVRYVPEYEEFYGRWMWDRR